jgi:uncharacterized protein (TIGR02996 family)
MNDGTAIIAAIHLHPDDDTARLVYADWLDEQAGERVACPECEATGRRPRMAFEKAGSLFVSCEKCDGRGTVLALPDAHDRAELVRVQVELARLPTGLKLCHHPDFKKPVKGYSRGLTTQPFECQQACPLCRHLYCTARKAALLAAHPTWKPECLFDRP